ncbi:GLABRA2 expression modulator [Sesamum angolense]|uniref:GLABRA2 expression modulator n=1 Tax=Sesamum angolense TaxID=2727404 RepID=A0AAE2BQE1_9LAMI|nr:GLABRA2 expression modulator [Sesamum angolense]
MEQPANKSQEGSNAEEKKPVSQGNDPTPIEKPAPEPKPEGSALKPGAGADDNTNDTTVDIDLNGRDGSPEENDIASPAGGLKPKKSVRWSHDLATGSQVPRGFDHGSSNPYVNYSPAPSANSSSFNFKDTMVSVKNVLGRWGMQVGEATRMAEDFAENTWQHYFLLHFIVPYSGLIVKTSPSLAEGALGRIAHGTKVLAEGGYEKIFRQTFETVSDEELKDSYACYLSTSAGPVMGVLYVSTAKLAFCSDNPLPYQSGDKTEWSYYKIVIPLHLLKAVNTSASRTNPAEKYIQLYQFIVDNINSTLRGSLDDGVAQSSQQENLKMQEKHRAEGLIFIVLQQDRLTPVDPANKERTNKELPEIWRSLKAPSYLPNCNGTTHPIERISQCENAILLHSPLMQRLRVGLLFELLAKKLVANFSDILARVEKYMNPKDARLVKKGDSRDKRRDYETTSSCKSRGEWQGRFNPLDPKNEHFTSLMA